MFNGPWDPKSGIAGGAGVPGIYETVTPRVVNAYGSDGLDNDANGVVDDPGEGQLAPPYPVPLRAIRIVVRTYDPTTQRVHQINVTKEFSR